VKSGLHAVVCSVDDSARQISLRFMTAVVSQYLFKCSIRRGPSCITGTEVSGSPLWMIPVYVKALGFVRLAT
jgi:hypothetical protein